MRQDGVEADETIALLAERDVGPGGRVDSNGGVARNSHKIAKSNHAS